MKQRSTKSIMNEQVIFKYMFCFLFVSYFFSCENKTVDYGLNEYYVEIVTAQTENIFLLDNGKKIFVTSDENKKKYDSGDRVYINYTLLETTASGDLNVRINGSTKIPLGKITLTNESGINSAPNEPVILESVWLGSHYLNMQFYLNFKSFSHKVGLLADSTRLENDTIRLYFLHDSNNDPQGYPSHSYLSFDLKDILGEPKKARPISVQINTSNYGNKTYGFEY